MNQGSLTLVGRSVGDVLDDVYHDKLLDGVVLGAALWQRVKRTFPRPLLRVPSTSTKLPVLNLFSKITIF